MDELVSIVMPIYNATKFLKSTLRSLQKQKYRNLEIICVDDGSSDDSVDIIKSFALKDKRFKLLQQKNMYAGVARNNGLSIANGEYCIFLDSDDLFHKDMIYDLVNTIEKKNVDMVVFGHNRFMFSKFIRKKSNLPFTNLLTSPEAIKDRVFSFDCGYPWNKFYKMSFLKGCNIQFSATKRNNDIYFSRMTTVLADTIYFFDKRLVYYRVGNRKSLQGNNNKKSDTEYIAIRQIIDEMKQRRVFETYYDSIVKMVLNYCQKKIEVFDEEEIHNKFMHCRELLCMLRAGSSDFVGVSEKQNELIDSLNTKDFEKYKRLILDASTSKK